MKKPIAIILAAIMMFALCACGNTATDSSDSGPTYVFTFGTVDTDEHPSTMSAKKLGEILNEKAPASGRSMFILTALLAVPLNSLSLSRWAMSIWLVRRHRSWRTMYLRLAFLICRICSPTHRKHMPFLTAM